MTSQTSNGPSRGDVLLFATVSILCLTAVVGAIAAVLLLRPNDEPPLAPKNEKNRSIASAAALDADSAVVGHDGRDRVVPAPEALAPDKRPAPARPSPKSRSSPLPPSLADIVESVRRGVVTVVTGDPDSGIGVGSGFIIHRSRWIATNHHVIAGAVQARAVRRRDGNDSGEEWINLGIEGFVACDPRRDLAILVLEEDWPSMPLELSGEKPRPGEDVFAIGTPKGLTETITRGIISQIRNAADIGYNRLAPATRIIQTDAFTTHGNSGGPLCSADGRVVGVNTFIRKDEEVVEFHFAVAAEELSALVRQSLARPVRPLIELPPRQD